MRKMIVAIAIVLGVLAAAVALAIGSGMYNVAADEEHTEFVYWLIETTRERSIAMRTGDINVPDLEDPQRIRRGAGNYDAMCAGCHLAPGAQATEISGGLYPRPPDLTEAAQSDPARAFWIIKHGVKSTGMPAWGKSMEDEYIWDLVALVRKLPEWGADHYAAEVRASGGHSHGGGESAEDSENTDSHDESGAGHSHEEQHSHDGQGAGGTHDHSSSASAADHPHN